MGCEPSIQKNLSEMTASQSSPDDFRISYREFVKNDVGEVFEFYHFSKIVNRSSTSLIRKVIHRVSKIERICKIVPIQKKHKIHAIKQVQNLKNLDHPNIVQIQQYFFDKTYLYIIMESINGNRLSQFLINHDNCSLDSLIRIFQQLLIALNYCHKNQIAHNLIQPDNIMVIEKGKDYFVKLLDFSEAGIIKSPKLSKIQFPKEFKMFKDVKSGNTTNEKNDIWSAGMTFLFMLSGEKSFDDFQANKKEIIKRKIDCFDIDETTGSKLLDLIMKLLQDQPENRPSVEEILKHEIFKEFRDQRPSSKHRKKGDNFMSRLMKFKAQSNLSSVFWMYASLNLLSSTQKCEYMTQFCNLDKNKDGKLDKKQIKQGLINTFNLSEAQADLYVDQIFKSIDKNNSASLEYSQFVMATSMISKYVSESQLQKIFKEIDSNNDGYITAEELGTLMGGMDEAVGLMRVKKKVSLNEFKQCMLQMFEISQQVQE